MYTAMTIAKWFIAWGEAEDDELSNMKLQKLLYYAQGHHLARTGEPLFGDEIQAWSHGPVVPLIYRAFRDFHANPIVLPDTDSFTWDAVDPETTNLLGEVWNTYGGYSAGRLRAMSHAEAPWRTSFAGGDDRGAVIPVSVMAEWFSQFEPVR